MRGCIIICPVQRVRNFKHGSFKTQKDPRQACALYELIVPFILSLHDCISSDMFCTLCLGGLAMAFITGGKYELWKIDYSERFHDPAVRYQQIMC